MQKKLLTAAVAGALAIPAAAYAQSTVQIYGAFDVSLHNYRTSASTPLGGVATSGISKWDVYNQSTRIGFKGTEDMGGGMKAWFQVEQNVAVDGRQQNPQAVAVGGRNSGVGLTSNWGSVLMGNWDSPYKVLGGVLDNASVGGLSGHRGVLLQNGDTTGAEQNLNCDNLSGTGGQTTAVCPQTEGGAASFHRRLSNTVQYWSPVFAGGFDIKFAFTANENKATANATSNNSPYIWATTLNYSSSVWRAFLGYENHNGLRDTAAGAAAGKTNVKDTAWMIGGGYNFGAVDLSVAYEKLSFADSTGVAATANDFKRNTWFIGLAVPIGTQGSAVRGGYSKSAGLKSCGAGFTGATAALSCSDSGARVITLGYDHALSKRTSIYAAYGQVRNDSNALFNFSSQPTGPFGGTTTIPAGSAVSTIGVGMKHAF